MLVSILRQTLIIAALVTLLAAMGEIVLAQCASAKKATSHVRQVVALTQLRRQAATAAPECVRAAPIYRAVPATQRLTVKL